MTRSVTTDVGPRPGLLDRERIIAEPGFNRWLVPPARWRSTSASAWPTASSVFWLPLSRAVGIDAAGRLSAGHGLARRAVHDRAATGGSSMLGWMYTLFFVLLGSSAAIWGGWLERAGPRKAGVVAALCWCGGLVISALGVYRPPAVADVARLGRHRRHRPRPRLHLAGLDADQVVPRPARHGDRHGDHGLRRRRDDRRAARRHA